MGDAVPRVPAPDSFTPLPQRAELLSGPRAFKARQKGGLFLTCQYPVGGSHAWAPASPGPGARGEGRGGGIGPVAGAPGAAALRAELSALRRPPALQPS